MADVASIYIQLKQTAPFDPITTQNSPRWDLPELGSMDAGEEKIGRETQKEKLVQQLRGVVGESVSMT
jgi:hypothetical protein